jgi:hypothetical protein
VRSVTAAVGFDECVAPEHGPDAEGIDGAQSVYRHRSAETDAVAGLRVPAEELEVDNCGQSTYSSRRKTR